MRTDIIIPKAVTSLIGTKMNQTSDDNNNEQSHRKAAATNMITRIGSCATVIVNIAKGGPNARNAHPKNSGKVIVTCNGLTGKNFFMTKCLFEYKHKFCREPTLFSRSLLNLKPTQIPAN